ncbi:MAG: gliding motility-associated C-terminal domain-containing protein [Bacteroidota bacterium]
MKKTLVPVVVLLALFIKSLWAQAPVQKIEYFIDVDPGLGSGTSLPAFSPAPTVSVSTSIDVSSLSLGFHTLYTRGQDVNGRWGIPASSLFFKTQATVIFQVAAVEYFFNRDPGLGNGIPVDPFIASTAVSLAESVDVSGLSPGFHTLFVRAQNQNGSWGTPTSRLIFVEETAKVRIVTAVEYFFNQDPGLGNATPTEPFMANRTVSLAQSVDISGLPPGFHTLFIRAQDQHGSWGAPAPSLIFVEQTAQIHVLDAVEYFFDQDPGIGKGDSLTNFTANQILNFSEAIPTNDLAPGLHNLYVRARNESGIWGILASRTVFVGESSFSQNEITAVEYFFNTDPGVGKGEVAEFSPRARLDSLLLADIFQLDAGLQTLYARAKTSTGTWGLPDTAFFSLIPSAEINIYRGNGTGPFTMVNNGETKVVLDSILVGTTLTDPFWIKNDGLLALTIDSIQSSNDEFLIKTPPSPTIAPGDSSQVVLSIRPTDLGLQQSTLFIGNNDPDENPFTFELCTFVFSIPKIAVFDLSQVPSVELTNGQPDPVFIGVTNVGVPLAATFKIQNNGTEVLEINSIWVEGQDFELAGALPEFIGPGDSANFEVSFTPFAVGTAEAYFEIRSNDPEKGIFTFTATGEALPNNEGNDDNDNDGNTSQDIIVYNAISPSAQDGNHDFLKIENIERFPNNEVMIFNRWGQKVYEADGYNNSSVVFTGDSNVGTKRELMDGTYFYVVSKGDGSENKAGFILLRR